MWCKRWAQNSLNQLISVAVSIDLRTLECERKDKRVESCVTADRWALEPELGCMAEEANDCIFWTCPVSEQIVTLVAA